MKKLIGWLFTAAIVASIAVQIALLAGCKRRRVDEEIVRAQQRMGSGARCTVHVCGKGAEITFCVSDHEIEICDGHNGCVRAPLPTPGLEKPDAR